MFALVITATVASSTASAPPELILRQAEPTISLSVETDEEGWQSAGLRVGFGYSAALVASDGAVPEGLVHTLVLDAGARLDESWSLLASFRYGVKTSAPGFFRWTGAVGPKLHVGQFSFGAAIGVGGTLRVVNDPDVPEPETGIVASYTIPGVDPLIGTCSGAGVAALLSADYQIIIGPLLAMGPTFEAGLSVTRCTQSLGRADPDTGETIELRQDWAHRAVSLGWTLWWR